MCYYVIALQQRIPSLYATRRELVFPSDSVEATRPNLTKLKRLMQKHIGNAAFTADCCISCTNCVHNLCIILEFRLSGFFASLKNYLMH